jgi:tetratricopeptide (TPR) repeat protein
MEGAIDDQESRRIAEARFEARFGPFVAFLEKAALAARRKKAGDRRLWLEAAAELFPLEDGLFDQISRDLNTVGRNIEAARLDETLCELFPDDARMHFRLAHSRQSLGDNDAAIPSLRRALALSPDLPHTRNNLAAALMSTAAPPEEIIALLDAAAAADPSEAEVWINLATQKLRVFDLDAALKAGARAVEMAPDSDLAHNNYAQALKEAGRFDEAEWHAERALALSPDSTVFQLNLGLLRLLRGRYAEGWPGYDSRWSVTPKRLKSRPELGGSPWRGEPLTGKTLLLWGEEGNGDVIQFSRLVPRMAERAHAQGGRLVWNSFPAFGDLLKRSFAEHLDAYSTGGIDLLPPFDYEFSLLSTARLLAIDEVSVPAETPYLRVDPIRKARWRQILSGERRLKVGLVWTGSPEQGRNPFRSVDLARYAAHLGGIANVAFYSLQLGGGDQVAAARARGFEITDHTAAFETYDDTAAFVDNLDLVITICTSVAHLAGALGKPTWIILDVNPHWVWRLEQRDNAWYPTVRLYRQRRFAEWEPVLEDLRDDLSAVAARQTRGA